MDKGRDTFVKICFIIDIKEFTTYYYSEKSPLCANTAHPPQKPASISKKCFFIII